MRTLLRHPVVVVVVVLALALVSSGCQATDSPALRVNGWELSRAEFNDQLKTLAKNDTMVALLQITPYSGEADNNYSTQYTSVLLKLHLTNGLLKAEVERRGLQIDLVAAEQALVDEIAAALSQQQFQTSGGDVTSEAQVLLDGSGWLKEAMVAYGAYSAALQADFAKPMLTDEALRELYDQVADQLSEACASHILIADSGDAAADLAKAQSLKAQLDANADFATLAEQNSDDPGSAAQGGDLGCAPKGSYVPEFDDYIWSGDIGAVSDPVTTSFGLHLVKITKRGTATFEDARPQLEQAATQQAGEAVQGWIGEAMTTADVWVDPRYGQWDPTAGFVIPPSGASIPSTTTTLGIETP